MTIQLDPCHYRVSVKALVTDASGKILLLRERQGVYDLPGGGLDHGEDPVTCLRREIREETGLEVDTMDATPRYFITATHTLYGAIANVIYGATCHPGDFVTSDECEELCYFTEEEFKQLPEELLTCNLLAFRRLYKGM